MPYKVDFDPANRILRCRFEGRVTDDEFTDFSVSVARYVAQTNPRGGISDLSAVTSWEVTGRTIRMLASRPPGVPPITRHRVFIAPSDQIFEMMRTFQHEAEVTRPNMHVVRTINEALAILGVSEFNFEPIET